MIIVADCHHVFGSGSGHAQLEIDGKKIPGEIDLGHNGFLGWRGADVPVEKLRSAKLVVLTESYFPGGGRKISCSGRSFVKKYLQAGPAAPFRVSTPLRNSLWHNRDNQRVVGNFLEAVAQKRNVIPFEGSYGVSVLHFRRFKNIRTGEVRVVRDKVETTTMTRERWLARTGVTPLTWESAKARYPL